METGHIATCVETEISPDLKKYVELTCDKYSYRPVGLLVGWLIDS